MDPSNAEGRAVACKLAVFSIFCGRPSQSTASSEWLCNFLTLAVGQFCHHYMAPQAPMQDLMNLQLTGSNFKFTERYMVMCVARLV